MRSPDLRKVKDLEKICVYEQVKSAEKQKESKQEIIRENEKVTRRILRRNKRKLHIRETMKKDFEHTQNTQKAEENKLTQQKQVNIYSNQFKKEKTTPEMLQTKPEKKLHKQKNTSSLEKEVKRNSGLINSKPTKIGSRFQYMSVDKYQRRANRPLERGQKELDKRRKRDFVRKFLKGKMKERKACFTSPDLAQKPLRSSDPRMVVRSKTKEEQMKSSGNSFFKYSISKIKKSLWKNGREFR